MDTLSDTLASQDQQTGRFFGKYRGLVTDNQDPLSLRRVEGQCFRSMGTSKQVGLCLLYPIPATA